MKTKLLALFLLSFTIIGLFFYFSEYFGVSQEGLSGELDTETNAIEEVFLEKKSSPSLEKVEEELSGKEKVQKIREKAKHFKVIELGENTFYFDIVGKKLILQVAENGFEIGSFDIVLEQDIEVEKIYKNPEKFLLSLDEKQYIFSKTSGILEHFDFKIPIKYIKEDTLYYIVQSEKGVFLLDKKTGNIRYAHIFSDFVLQGGNYLAIIQSDDTKRLQTYDLDQNTKDKIFFYNPVSKEQKVVLESDISLEKIYKIGENIFFENAQEEVFELKNF